MDRAGRETWAKRVERWTDSGLTAKEFARETGINARSLRWWKWQLASKAHTKDVATAKPDKAAATRRRRRGEPKPAGPLTFVEVPTAAIATNTPIEIVVSARLHVRVVSGFDDATLTRVLDVLERRT